MFFLEKKNQIYLTHTCLSYLRKSCSLCVLHNGVHTDAGVWSVHSHLSSGIPQPFLVPSSQPSRARLPWRVPRPGPSSAWPKEGLEGVPRRFIMRGQHTQKTAFKFQSQTRPVGPPRRVWFLAKQRVVYRPNLDLGRSNTLINTRPPSHFLSQ